MIRDSARQTTVDLMNFIAASPTAAHAVAASQERLGSAGFRRVHEWDPWEIAPGDRFYVTRGDTALIAVHAGSLPPAEAGFRIVGAHTDSPGFRLKANALVDSAGYTQLGVEVYGGPLLASWADRDLGIAGRILVRGPDDRPETRLVCLRRPLCRIPLLAIHLDRDVNDKGLTLDRQKHLAPVLAMSDSLDEGRDPIRALIADAGDLDPDAILGWSLELFDLQPPTLGGLADEFYFAPRIDNLAGCHAALLALTARGGEDAATRVVALFHSEEVGSATPEGAQSSFLEAVLERLSGGGDRPRESYHRALARSILASVDGAHGLHPSHVDRHEPRHRTVLNGGPVIKINAMERYATTLHTDAHLQRCAERADVPLQRYIHRTDLPCGSTIGPLSATRIGVATADLGVPMLSMHSVREMGGTSDQEWMIRLLAEHLAA